MPARRHLASTLLVAAAAPFAAHAATCSATAGPSPTTVVELYTSEGCSSCPPADRWLQTLGRQRNDVLALGFHVEYWDYIGWPDRFASAQYSERQRRLAAAASARQVYTPQVVVNGRDWRNWGGALPAAASAPAPVLKLERNGTLQQYTVSVPALPAPAAGYWAVLEDGHRSAVRAGENAGATLQHDHVVRLYRPIAAWPAGAATQWQLTLTSAADAQTPRRVAFVLTDAQQLKPQQAVVLPAGC